MFGIHVASGFSAAEVAWPRCLLVPVTDGPVAERRVYPHRLDWRAAALTCSIA